MILKGKEIADTFEKLNVETFLQEKLSIQPL
jgi:hypothetical protein